MFRREKQPFWTRFLTFAAGLAMLAAGAASAEPITWEPLGPASGAISHIRQVQQSAFDPTILYAATDGGLIKSTNGGVTWTLIGSLPAASMASVALSGSDPCILYAGSDAGLGVFRSTDCGLTWTSMNSGLGSLVVNVIALDPIDPSRVYAGTNGAGVFFSTDQGVHWTPPSAAPSGDQRVLSIALDHESQGRAFLGTQGGGVFASLDGGMTWSDCNNGIPTFNDPDGRVANAVVIQRLDPQILYAGFRTGGVYRSIDGGANWNACSTGLPSAVMTGAQSGGGVESMAFADGTLFLAAEGAGAFQLQGSTWSDVTFEMTGHTVRTLAMGAGAHSLFAGTRDAGVFGALAPAVTVVVALAPATLNRDSHGLYATLYIEPHGRPVTDIDPATVRLNGTMAPVAKPAAVGDYDSDGYPDLALKFARADLAALPLGSNEVAVTGAFLGGDSFTGTASIRIIDPGANAARIRLDVLSAPLLIPVRMSVSGSASSVGMVRVYDVQGRIVRSWPLRLETTRRIEWDGLRSDGTRAASGIYFARAENNAGDRATARIVIAR